MLKSLLNYSGKVFIKELEAAKGGRGTEKDILCAAVLLKSVKNKNKIGCNFSEALDCIEDEKIKEIIKKSFLEKSWDILKNSLNVNETMLDEIIYAKGGADDLSLSEEIPESIQRLAIKLLEVKNGESVLHFECGDGSAMRSMNEQLSDCVIEGAALNKDKLDCAQLKSYNCEEKNVIHFREADIFSEEMSFEKKYDKILCTPKFGGKLRKLEEKFPYLKSIFSDYKGGISAEWIYCKLLNDMIDGRGIAVALMPGGSMSTNLDKKIRENLIKNSRIKAVILLPNKMMIPAFAKPALVIFGNGEGTVKMVDASEIFTKERRVNVFSEENTEKIMGALNEDGEYSKSVSIDDIVRNDYNLSPDIYFNLAKSDEKNWVRLCELVTLSSRPPLSGREVDELTTMIKTGWYYLRSSEIQDGFIIEDLPRLKLTDREMTCLALRKNDVVIARTYNRSFKIALYRRDERDIVLPMGNVIVLRARDGGINPVFLKAYLESEEGEKNLKSTLTGNSLQVISLAALRDMRIPLPPKEIQEWIAEKYLAVSKEIEDLQKKTLLARERLAGVIKGE